MKANYDIVKAPTQPTQNQNEEWRNLKVCCYAICASESEEFIRRWLTSMAPADYIAVLVTKANDPDMEIIPRVAAELGLSDKLIIEEEDIKPWRFDTARNASMKLIPKDKVDFCICTDIDEILIPDFWDDMKQAVYANPNRERYYYQYAWNHDEVTGEPKRYFYYDKCHLPNGFEWRGAVHEYLYNYDNTLNYGAPIKLTDKKIYLHHYPDQTKSRGNYLPLLELRQQDNPSDFYGMYYLAREYTFYNKLDGVIRWATELYNSCFRTNAEENARILLSDRLTVPAASFMCADAYAALGLYDDAEYWYERAIKLNPDVTESYMRMAQFYARTSQIEKGWKALERCDANGKEIHDWRLADWIYRTWKRKQIEGLLYYNNAEFDKAKKAFDEGFADIKTQSDANEAHSERFYSDREAIELAINKVEKDDSTKKLSIIIPYHNEGYDYIHKLLSSLDNQICANWNDVEIIISNNCEEPHNEDIKIETYKNIKDCVKFVYPEIKNNIGLSRQCGVDNASGKFIMYCDSDDLVYSNKTIYDLFEVFRMSEKHLPDIYFVKEFAEAYEENSNGEEVHGFGLVDGKNCRRDIYIHDKIYSREFLIRNNIRFCDKIRYNEDGYYNIVTLLANPKILDVDLFTYIQVFNPKSITRCHEGEFDYYMAEQVALAEYYGYKDIYNKYGENLNRDAIMPQFYFYANHLYWLTETYYRIKYGDEKARNIETLLARNINTFDPEHKYFNLLDSFTNKFGDMTLREFVEKCVNNYDESLIEAIEAENNKLVERTMDDVKDITRRVPLTLTRNK